MPATRRRLQWRRELQRARTNSSPPSPYGRRALLGAVLALLLAATAFAAPRHLFTTDADRSFLPDDKARSSLSDVTDRRYLSTDGWPERGQGAYVLDDGRPAVSPNQRPVPIASVAKVMTAYLVLKHHPLRAGDSGPRFVVEPGDVVDTERRRHRGESIVDVRAGQQLTEREAFMAILLPSANNIAVPVAGEVTNTNALLGHDGFVGMKTGSHDAAGGCLMFRVVWPTESGSRSLVGVVLGQRGDDLITAGVSAAKQLADRLAPNAGRLGAGQPGVAPPAGA